MVGNELAVHCAFGKSYLRLTMRQLEETIDPDKYIKASRSELLRLDKVEHFEKDEAGAMIAVMESKVSIKTSRRQAQKIKAK